MAEPLLRRVPEISYCKRRDRRERPAILLSVLQTVLWGELLSARGSLGGGGRTDGRGGAVRIEITHGTNPH